MTEPTTVTVALKVTSSDKGFRDFIFESRRTGKLPRLLVDLLHYYYKNESVQRDLQSFILQEDEFYANVTQQFREVLEQHPEQANGLFNLAGLPIDQVAGLLANMQKAMPQPQPMFIQQINPNAPHEMGYMNHVPMQQVPMQQVPQLPVQPVPHVPVYQEVPVNQESVQQVYSPPVQPTQAVQPPTGAQEPLQAQGAEQQAATVQPVYSPTVQQESVQQVPNVPKETAPPNDAPAGLFADDDEDGENTGEQANVPEGLSRMIKSIKKKQ